MSKVVSLEDFKQQTQCRITCLTLLTVH